jgi:hypothetical protein
MPTAPSTVIREGVSAGLIGATAIAAWFGVIDAIAGTLLATPIMLGASLSTLFAADASPAPATSFVLYTLFHFAMFTAIGLFFAWVVSLAEEAPSALIGFFGLFVMFEVGWVGWTTVLAQGFGELTWLQVFIANLIGAAAMGYYMYRQHPALPRRVSRVLVTTE